MQPPVIEEYGVKEHGEGSGSRAGEGKGVGNEVRHGGVELDFGSGSRWRCATSLFGEREATETGMRRT